MIDSLQSWLDRVRHASLTLLLDLDGTLIPFADSVELAVLDRPVVNLLDALTFAGVQVVIVSGRQRLHIDRVRSVANVWWVAEHGSWKRSNGDWTGPREASELVSLVHALDGVTSIPGVVIERKSLGLCVHWRLVRPQARESVLASLDATFGAWLEHHLEYERRDGIEVAEVRHRSVTKASAVAWVRDQRPDAHVIAIGDDDTDEDMFAALRPGEMPIAVRSYGDRPTRARASLSGPTAVRAFLWWVLETRGRRHERPPPIDPVR